MIDNCEHLIDSCAHVIDHLLHACRAVTILTTSRQPLGAGLNRFCGCHLFRYPPTTRPVRRSWLGRGALFVDRAQQARAGFELTPANAGVVAEICRRLDGIRSLELAAARIRIAPVERSRRVDRTVPCAHRCARTVLRRTRPCWLPSTGATISSPVTSGSCCGAWPCSSATSPPTPPNRSWPATTSTATWYSSSSADSSTRAWSNSMTPPVDQLLETIRQYALDRCRRAGELEQFRDRHMRWAVGFLESIDNELCDRPILAAIDDDYPNLRTAIEWSTERGTLGDAIRLVGGLAMYWGLCGRHRTPSACPHRFSPPCGTPTC